MIDAMLRNAITHAVVSRRHVVILFDTDNWTKALRMAGLYMPSGAKAGGRSWLLPNGGVVTLAEYKDNELGGSFDIAAYFPDIAHNTHLNRWVKAANQSLSWQ